MTGTLSSVILRAMKTASENLCRGPGEEHKSGEAVGKIHFNLLPKTFLYLKNVLVTPVNPVANAVVLD